MFRSKVDAFVVRFAAALLSSMLAAAPAEGSLYRIDFSGYFDAMTTTGPGIADPRFTGSLIYDDSIPLGAPTPSVWTPGQTVQSYASGVFRTSNPTPDGTGLDIKIAGVSIAPVSNGLQGGWYQGTYGDGQPYSGIDFGTSTTPAPHAVGVGISFEPNDPALFSGGKIPEGLKLSDLSKAVVSVNNVMYGVVYEGTSSFVYAGVIDSLTVTPVPEPAWTVAALMGAALWTIRRRVRKS